MGEPLKIFDQNINYIPTYGVADWKNQNEIKLDYPSASILNNDRVIFNISGNSYRLIVKINYDYYKINANEI